MHDLNVRGRVAWITGGSRGIGKATALQLAKAGCNVAIMYRSRADEANEVIRLLRELDVRAEAIAGDISVRADVERVHTVIKEKLGPVSILVNAAGVTADDLFLMMDDDAWQRVMGTNLMGTVYAIHCCIRDMMSARWGRIVNVSSVAATRGGRGQANYAASKGAVEAMTRSLAVELGGRGITVNCLAPGVIETDMSAEVIRLAKDEILARQVIKRFGTPDEVATWISMLASDWGAFMTGQTIHLDGGMKMP